MAHASSKTFGPGQQDHGKGDGSGGLTPSDLESLPPREILSNRDTSRHSDQRGLDGAHVRAQQLGEGEAGAEVPEEELVDRPLDPDRPDANG